MVFTCPLHEHLRGDLEQHSSDCCQLGTPDLHMEQAVLCQSKIWFSTQSAAISCGSPTWLGKGRKRFLVCVQGASGPQNKAHVVAHRICLSSSTRGNTRPCAYSKANTDFSVSCLYLCTGQAKRVVWVFVANEQIQVMTELDPGSLSDNKPAYLCLSSFHPHSSPQQLIQQFELWEKYG